MCNLYKPPYQIPKSGIRSDETFNDRLLVDTLWIHVHTHSNPRERERAILVLAMLDAGTKFMVARILDSETTDSFLKCIERGWIRHYGTPHKLQVDEHRGWASDTLKAWTSDHGVDLIISPGQAHTRLSLVERRHQVLRKATELFIADYSIDKDMFLKEILTTALIFVVS